MVYDDKVALIPIDDSTVIRSDIVPHAVTGVGITIGSGQRPCIVTLVTRVCAAVIQRNPNRHISLIDVHPFVPNNVALIDV